MTLPSQLGKLATRAGQRAIVPFALNFPKMQAWLSRPATCSRTTLEPLSYMNCSLIANCICCHIHYRGCSRSSTSTGFHIYRMDSTLIQGRNCSRLHDQDKSRRSQRSSAHSLRTDSLRTSSCTDCHTRCTDYSHQLTNTDFRQMNRGWTQIRNHSGSC